jgi:arginine/lysine/ornithine decarboxylase
MSWSESRTAGEVAGARAQERAPVYEALLAYQQRQMTPLHTPGHKGRWVPSGLEHFLTPLGVACDLPAMEATDNWFHPQHCIAEAQRLAAELYGAADSFYLVNGSTIGVQAMMLAAVAPGEKVLLSRYLHLSAFSALVLSGAVPVYLPARWLQTAGPVPPTADEVEQYLQRHPDTRAVFLTHPTYYGVGRPLEPLADACHRRGVALLADEAHGAHLRFLPPGSLRSGLDGGADLVVQSVHKTVGSLVGTAQMHRSHGSIVSRERLQTALNLLQSTSSNYLLLSSLDLTRRAMWREGQALFRHAVERAAVLRENLDAIDGIQTLDATHCDGLEGCASDPLRLLVDVSGLGLTGFQVERRLQEEFRILDEFCDMRNVAFVLGPTDDPETYSRLARAFSRLAAERSATARARDDVLYSAPVPPVVLTPREAAFRPKRKTPLRAALGCVSGETITVYPPGIPHICPGEQFTAELLEHLAQLSGQSACVFSDDPSLATVTIVD